MKFSTAFFLLSITTTNAFAPTAKLSRTSNLHVSSQSSQTNNKDLAKDFDNTSPEDVTPSGNGAKVGQAEVVLVGCGAPNRGMGWYHAVQMLEGR